MKKYDNYFISDFLVEKEVNQGLSKETIKTYYTMFNYLINSEYINIDDPLTLTEINFKRLFWQLLIEKNWTSHTYNRNKKCAKVFCDYLIKEWYIDSNPLSKIKDRKIDKVLPKIYSQKQIDMIIYTINNYYNSFDNFVSIRNKTIMLTYIYTWLRFKELVNLNINDINIDEWYIKVSKWKGSKDRYVPLVNKLHLYLKKYLDVRNKIDFKKNIMFPTYLGNNLQYREIYNINKFLQDKLWFKVSTHMFRHTFATELVKKNLNLYNISQILWHSKLDTTKVYLNFDTDKVRDSMNLLNLYC